MDESIRIGDGYFVPSYTKAKTWYYFTAHGIEVEIYQWKCRDGKTHFNFSYNVPWSRRVEIQELLTKNHDFNNNPTIQTKVGEDVSNHRNPIDGVEGRPGNPFNQEPRYGFNKRNGALRYTEIHKLLNK